MRTVDWDGRITDSYAPITGMPPAPGFVKGGSALNGINRVNQIFKTPKGFKQTTKFGYQHGQKVYKYNGKYYSRDIDAHSGGVWKVFEESGGRLKRIGTADEHLTIFKP
jgi:hypothetical protein